MNKSTLVILGIIVVAIVAYFITQGSASTVSGDVMMKDDTMMDSSAKIEAEAMMKEDAMMAQ